MGRRVISNGCHLAEQKNGDFASGKTATLRLSGSCHPTERSWMEVGCGASSSGLHSKRRLFIASDKNMSFGSRRIQTRVGCPPPRLF
ncbi:unnamed protein product [Spirodela intermedia]|uniref:Uncharacterized protein n=1 Tax=Spirodela intermedia TaxID=51605 RepID=A0A7I8K6L1_SPIIN|nr:unnamed protein product [Spirodela intermedia]